MTMIISGRKPSRKPDNLDFSKSAGENVWWAPSVNISACHQSGLVKLSQRTCNPNAARVDRITMTRSITSSLVQLMNINYIILQRIIQVYGRHTSIEPANFGHNAITMGPICQAKWMPAASWKPTWKTLSLMITRSSQVNFNHWSIVTITRCVAQGNPSLLVTGVLFLRGM